MSIEELEEKVKELCEEYYEFYETAEIGNFIKSRFKNPNNGTGTVNPSLYAKDYIKYKMSDDNEDFEMGNYPVKENTATATAGNVSGMGAVVSAQPSSIPGATIGSNTVGDSYGGDGVVGSGDIANVGFNRNIRERPSGSRRKNKAKAALKSVSKNKTKKSDSDTKSKKTKNVENFSDFIKKFKK